MVKSISKKGNKIDPKLEKLSDFKNNLSKLLNQNEIDEILEIVHLFPVKWKIDSKHQDKNLVRLVNKYSPIENKAEIWDILYNISKLQRKKNVDKEIANSSYYLERFVKYEFSKQAEFDVWTKLIAKYKALLKNETTKKLIRYFEIVKKIVQNSFELEEVQLQCLKAFLEILANPDEYMDQITKNTSISKESLKSLYEGYHKKLMKIMKEQHKTGISSNLINQVFLNKQPCQNYALNQIENFSQKNQNNNESYEDQTKENEDIFDEDLEKIKNVEVVNLEKITMNEKVVNFEDYNEEENMDSNEQNDEKQFVHTNEVHKNEKYQNIPVFTTLMDEKSTESREGYSGSDDSVSKFYDAFNHTKYHSEKDQNVNGLYVDYKEEKDSQNQENEYIDLEDGEKIIKNAKVGNYEVNNEERNMDSNEENDENQLVLMKFKTMKIIKILQIFTNQWN